MTNSTNPFFEEFLSQTVPSFGVAGNFTGHLEQAGEAVDFAKFKTNDAAAPKALFPTFIPRPAACPDFLHVFPFDHQKIIYPKEEQKVQIEPECALIFRALWSGDELADLKPLCFGASNDCSIRKEGAKKISLKKNWGASSKGLSKNLIALNDFSKDGLIDDYRIASFLIRSGDAFDYGEDSAVRDYSYVYGRLTQWLLEKFNRQADEGPAEDIHSYLTEGQERQPEKIMISIGATRYTEWGQKNFLKDGDVTAVIVYPESRYSHEDIRKISSLAATTEREVANTDISALVQRVVV